ncbi:division/cell wall cluster transcriptional repressor MraZ [Saprospiraceae bacterium]|nr:division/cell wall cluster transcriptional repressor MraZ [Saprospiraceae bacterium]
MLNSLTGEFDCKLDAKGRMRLPAQLMKQLASYQSDEFIVNRGYENHLMLYPKAVWGEKTKEINRLNLNVKEQRQAIRYFYRGASEIKVDGSERVLLPKPLLDYAGIEREVVLFAYQEQIEIWDKKSYEEMLDNEPENFSDLAEKIWGNNSTSEEQ